MGMTARFGFGIPAALVAGFVGGPTLAYAAWKVVGFAATGNPLYLVPGGSTVSDGFSLVADAAVVSADTAELAALAADAGDLSGVAPSELADRNVWDQPMDRDIWGREKMDVYNQLEGRNHLGEMPTDIQGKRL